MRAVTVLLLAVLLEACQSVPIRYDLAKDETLVSVTRQDFPLVKIELERAKILNRATGQIREVVVDRTNGQSLSFDESRSANEAAWRAQQMIEAVAFDAEPSFLLRDRDRVYGERFQRRVQSLGVRQGGAW